MADAPAIKSTVLGVLTGRVGAFGPKGEPSGFRKDRRRGAVAVGPLGLEGDEQGDLVHHGGREKAIHHYPFDHYATWAGERPAMAGALEAIGAFGENIATRGLTEADVCVGDRFRLGTALVEVSQGRQPCWKLGHRFGDPALVARVVKSGRSGWYYRVIEPGKVAEGDTIELVERPWPAWPVARVFRLLIQGRPEPGELEALAEVTALAEPWTARRLAALAR